MTIEYWILAGGGGFYLPYWSDLAIMLLEKKKIKNLKKKYSKQIGKSA